jgi:membrane-bound metal-dependent hydrolase YbcI (DUF457 family)
MILGHLAIASIAKRKFLAENFIFLCVASYGPDLIDKPLSLAFVVAGRGVGHSLLMFALVTAAAWLFCQRFGANKQLIYIGAVLWLSHLTADLVDLKTFLWPFLGPLPIPPSYSLMESLKNYYILRHHPIQLSVEILLIIIAMIWWMPYSLRSRLKFFSPLTRVDGR